MNRVKLMMMTMNRFKLLLCTAIVAAVTVLVSGIGVSYADPVAPAAKAAESAAAQAPRAAAAVRARAKRAELLKKKEASRKYIQNVVEGQQNQPVTGADNAGKGVAK